MGNCFLMCELYVGSVSGSRMLRNRLQYSSLPQSQLSTLLGKDI